MVAGDNDKINWQSIDRVISTSSRKLRFVFPPVRQDGIGRHAHAPVRDDAIPPGLDGIGIAIGRSTGTCTDKPGAKATAEGGASVVSRSSIDRVVPITVIAIVAALTLERSAGQRGHSGRQRLLDPPPRSPRARTLDDALVDLVGRSGRASFLCRRDAFFLPRHVVLVLVEGESPPAIGIVNFRLLPCRQLPILLGLGLLPERHGLVISLELVDVVCDELPLVCFFVGLGQVAAPPTGAAERHDAAVGEAPGGVARGAASTAHGWVWLGMVGYGCVTVLGFEPK